MNRPTVWGDVENESVGMFGKPPGIYEDVSFDDYVLIDAINHTRLCRIDKSPLNYLVAPEREKSQAFALGSLIHCGSLEPDKLRNRYAIMPDFANSPDNKDSKGMRSTSPLTTWCKEAVKAFREAATADNREVVTEAQFQQMTGAMSAIKTCPQFARDVIKSRRELTIVWHDRHTGLLCKARIDAQTTGKLIDVKTKDDSQESGPLDTAFEWSMHKYNYHTQAAWYLDGWATLTGETCKFWFAVLTTHKPHQCIYAPIGDVSIDVGRLKNRERMSQVLACKQNDDWPGYQSPEFFELPDKYLPEMDV